jgi:hypothetical protein
MIPEIEDEIGGEGRGRGSASAVERQVRIEWLQKKQVHRGLSPRRMTRLGWHGAVELGPFKPD